VPGDTRANVAVLVNVAALVGKRALAVEGTALASNELASLFLGHVLVAVAVAVVVVVRVVVDVVADVAAVAGVVVGVVVIVVAAGHCHVGQGSYVEKALAQAQQDEWNEKGACESGQRRLPLPLRT
jgi:hypothetical protein